MMTTGVDDVEALTAAVAAEPDAARRAALLGVDLSQLAAARRRFQAACWGIAILLAIAVASAPISRFLELPPAFRDPLLHIFTGRWLLGAVIAFLAFPVARVASGVVGALLRGGGVGRFLVRTVLGIAMTPLMLLLAGLVSASSPLVQVGIIASTPLAAAVLGARITDLAARIRANEIGVTGEILRARELPAAQTLGGGRIRWMVLESGLNMLHWTATALLVIAQPWSLPAVVAGRLLLLVVQNDMQRGGAYRSSLAVGAVFVVAVSAIALLVGSHVLFPSGLVTYGLQNA